jgi:CHAD domain-containing protein
MALDVNRAEKPVRKLRKLLKKMPAMPGADDIHAFRTNSRRIEATLQALSLDSENNCRRILKELSHLRKRAGKVRDMDVLTDYLLSQSQREKEKECSVQLLEHLGAQRQRYAKKFDSARQQYALELNKRLKRTSRQMGKVLPSNGKKDPDGDSVSAEVTASALRLLAGLSQPARLGKTNLHPYRLKVKELRNLLQMAENSDQQEFVQHLGEVKDAIGEWHDWEELAAIAREVLDHGANCQLLPELRRTAETKYRNALALSAALRKKFLRMPEHGNKRKAQHRQRGPAEPVWLATAALVA